MYRVECEVYITLILVKIYYSQRVIAKLKCHYFMLDNYVCIKRSHLKNRNVGINRMPQLLKLKLYKKSWNSICVSEQNCETD